MLYTVIECTAVTVAYRNEEKNILWAVSYWFCGQCCGLVVV